MKRKLSILAGAALALAMTAGDADAQSQASAPDAVAGVVTQVDRAQGRVTVRSADGKEVQFDASPETLRDLEVGDRIEAKKRSEPPKR